MEATQANLDIKVTQLKMSIGKTNTIVEAGKAEAIERHLSTLRSLTTEINRMRLEVEATKLAAKEEIADIEAWNSGIDAQLEKADYEVDKMRTWVDDRKREAEAVVKQEELKFHKAKIQMQAEIQATAHPQETMTTPSDIQAKLPKLTITKFDGTYKDWPRFWGQFTETIDKTSVPPITKFSYLRELLDFKVKRTIEALPFTAEGYNRAKSILNERFGKESEIVKAYIKEILDLPSISSANPRKIGEFSEKLTYCVQALQTLNKLEQVNGAASMTLDKLPAIRGDLVRIDPSWESWDLAKLSEAVRLWTRRNPADTNQREQTEQQTAKQNLRQQARIYHTRRGSDLKPRCWPCVYCGEDHKAVECTKVTDVSDRRQILLNKRLCFNCTAGNHRAVYCPSKSACQQCRKRHHTSICEVPRQETNQPTPTRGVALTTNQVGEGLFPVIVIEVNGIKCRALIDSGAGSSYVSAKLIELLRLKPADIQTKTIDMLMSSKVARLEVYDLELQSVDHQYSLSVKATKVNKTELLSIDNPNYRTLIEKYSHLKGVHVNDDDTKASLPVHVVLGSGEYARIKTETKPRIGRENDPVAELTRFGWFLMSPGKEFDKNIMLFTQTSQSDYEDLCKLDVLGLRDVADHDQAMVYEEFKEQLTRSQEGWYETTLPWKANHSPLPSNKEGSLKRLKNLTRKLQREDLTVKYNDIIQEQLTEGVIEKAPPVSQPEKEFYIPHKCVIRKSAETTKMRIVYDASARATPNSPSLNDCLYSGPPLQNRLWDVLVQQRAYPVVLAGDIQKAFLQIRIHESERDALRFHWQTDGTSEVETYRFTRVLFGLGPSPFLLGGVLEYHFDSWAQRYPEEAERLRRSFYVDDLLTGGQNEQQTKARKEIAQEIMSDATFKLHKWHSNCPELEEDSRQQETEIQSTQLKTREKSANSPTETEEQSYAKQQLQVKPSESKLLGVKWNKVEDTIAVQFPVVNTSSAISKREVLAKLAKVYDPLGLVSPVTLQGKQIYREVCDYKAAWDAPIPENLRVRWLKWEHSLPDEVTIRRPIAPHQQPVLSFELHVFGDASTHGVGAAVYSVVRQEDGITQTLVVAKARLAKRNLTVPRLELVSAHMATNLVVNVRNALKDLPEPTVYGWLDSTVALHWILGNGLYRQFVANRVQKIKQHPQIQWRHVPTSDNPADLASRGGQVTNAELWWNGPSWLRHPENWPENPVTEKTQASEEEAKVIREVLSLANVQPKQERNVFDELLERHDLRRTLRIQAWVRRFTTHRARKGPLTSEDIQESKNWWIRRVQSQDAKKPYFEQTRRELNLVPNADGVLECHGRVQGQYPVYLPAGSLFTRKLVQRTHAETLHGGVSLTMAAIREEYWIPTLRQLVKSVRSACWGCKRFRALPLTVPPPGPLPTDRTHGRAPFEVIGTDFAGPIYYRLSQKREGKAYLVIFSCSLSRAVHLELVPNLETSTFLPCLKRLIARRGRPAVIYSDNGSTFVKAAKWLKQVRSDEQLQGFLESHDIQWKFNLSRAPWWGGQFERLIGIVKTAMYKVIGGATLSWSELNEVILDVETQVNRRPLGYVEDDVELPILTPASLMFQRTNQLPEEQAWRIQDPNLRRRAKYLQTCKDHMWNRWQREYLTALRERHNLVHKTANYRVRVGDTVLVRSDSKNRGKWPLAIVQQTYPGRDGHIRAVQLRTSKGVIERPVQHLYPLELQCEPTVPAGTERRLNHNAPIFRPRRTAAAAAAARIKEIAYNEEIEQF